MKYLFLLLIAPLAWSSGNGHHDHHSHDGPQRVTVDTGPVIVNAVHTDSGGSVEGGQSNLRTGDTILSIDQDNDVSSSVAPVHVSYCSGGLSVQGRAGGVSVGGDESSCRKRGIREITINEMHRQAKLGNDEKVAEYNLKIIKLVDDMHDNEDTRNFVEKIWIWIKVAAPIVGLALLV